MLLLGALLTGGQDGRGRWDAGGSSRGQGQVASQHRGCYFVTSSTLAQPGNPNTTDGFCPLGPLERVNTSGIGLKLVFKSDSSHLYRRA